MAQHAVLVDTDDSVPAPDAAAEDTATADHPADVPAGSSGVEAPDLGAVLAIAGSDRRSGGVADPPDA